VRFKLADELQVDIMPVLLGNGLRLFEHISDQPVNLEKIKVLETPIRTSLHFRIVK
jgi:dihydrofolate reductase